MNNRTYIFSIHELIDSPYNPLKIFLDTEYELEDTDTEYKISNNGEIHFSANITYTGTGVNLKGNLKFTELNYCSKCLKNIEIQHSEKIDEYYFFENEKVDEDSLIITNEEIDIFPIITDSIVLSINLFAKCKNDCLGLCLDCGVDLNENHNHSHQKENIPVNPIKGLNKLSDLIS